MDTRDTKLDSERLAAIKDVAIRGLEAHCAWEGEPDRRPGWLGIVHPPYCKCIPANILARAVLDLLEENEKLRGR